MVSLAEYWDKLERFDWLDQNHDIPPREAVRVKRELLEISTLSPAHRDLYRQFVDHHFGGPPWGKDTPPKPKRPEK
jgi:hypothetical protein